MTQNQNTSLQNVRVRSIWQKDAKTLAIEWTDMKTQEFDVVALRLNCPCAACIDELSGERKIKAEDISPNVRPIQVHSVGRYALGIEFTDGHKTGIYTFDYLRNNVQISS